MSVVENASAQLRLQAGAGRGPLELPEVGLRGTGLHPITMAECVDFILDELDAGRGGWLLASNLDHMRRVRKDAAYKDLYGQATLRIPAGASLGWACMLQRTPLPACTQVAHLLSDLTREASRAGRRIFLVAESDELATGAAEELRKRFGEVDIVGTAGIVHASLNDDLIEFARIGRSLVKANPDLIIVSLDTPFQEHLINFLRADQPKAWWIGLDHELKRLALGKRAPRGWMSSLGLDWLGPHPNALGGRLKKNVLLGFPMLCMLLGRCMLRGMIPKGKTATRYGRRRPRALLVDDDEHALAHLELLLSSRFPQLDIHTRTDPDVSGGYEFYFIDNDFNGKHLASQLAAHIRQARPQSMIFAFSGVLNVETLKGLINEGCDGVCDKSDPKSWKEILDQIDAKLKQIVDRHAGDRHAFGGIRGSALSIQRLLRHWNRPTPKLKQRGDEHGG